VTDRLDASRLDELWDFDDPRATAARFEREIAALAGEHPVAVAELTTQLARARGLLGLYAEADELLDGIASSAAVVQVRIALERGRVQRSSGKPEASLPFFRTALELAKAAGEDFLEVDALHMLALVDGPEWAAEALRRVAETTDPRTQRWGIALHNNLGWDHFDAERYPEALEEFILADAAAQAHGTPDQQRWAQEAIAEARAQLAP
jgi:tetratricopeptide (TPR) repeat protein